MSILGRIKGTANELIDSISNALKVSLHDGYGNPIKSFEGALNIHDSHPHNEIINVSFNQRTATTTTFAVDATAGSTQITLTSATGFAIGDYLHLQDGDIENVNPKINNLVGTVATLDRPIDNNYLIGDEITKTLIDLSVLGSLASPMSFKVQPEVGGTWHIMRILIAMTHSTAGDNGLFGNITELNNGVVLRRYDGTTGKFNAFTIWKSNGDIASDVYDISYTQRSGGGGAYGTNARGTFYSSGAVVRLDGTAGDYLELLIQDDISSLAAFKVKVQGHIEGI